MLNTAGFEEEVGGLSKGLKIESHKTRLSNFDSIENNVHNLTKIANSGKIVDFS
jgi:hypothetical protein